VPFTNCGGFCANLYNNFNNCGTCYNTCPAGSVCSNGTCAQACAAGLETCGSGTSVWCANLQTDINNCGWCGHDCNANERCIAGVCTP
jgi:hypothetical protein